MDIRAIACNIVSERPAYSMGSLAYVVQLSNDRARILVRSRGNRWIRCWVPIVQLTSFRFRKIPPEHPLYERIVEIGSPEFFSDSDLTALARRRAL